MLEFEDAEEKAGEDGLDAEGHASHRGNDEPQTIGVGHAAEAGGFPFQDSRGEKGEAGGNDEGARHQAALEGKQFQQASELGILRQQTASGAIEPGKDAEKKDLETHNRHHAGDQQGVGVKLNAANVEGSD